jgi:hypothetical protein
MHLMSPEHGPEGVDIIEIIISSLRDMILFWHLKLVMLVPLSEIFYEADSAVLVVKVSAEMQQPR